MSGTYLDCGCYVDESGIRHWCPTCSADTSYYPSTDDFQQQHIEELEKEKQRLGDALKQIHEAANRHQDRTAEVVDAETGGGLCHRGVQIAVRVAISNALCISNLAYRALYSEERLNDE